MNSAVWGFVGVLVGGFINFCAEWMRMRSSARMDDMRRDLELRASRDAFQRNNLLETQEALARFAREEGRLSMFDQQTIINLGYMTQMPEELNNEVFESRRQLSYRIERVVDDSLRIALDTLSNLATQLDTERSTIRRDISADGVFDDLNRLVIQHQVVQELLGKSLRSYL